MELLESGAQVSQELEKLRAPMTILFSDIKGSTRYAEKKGDVAYVAMINRHNQIVFPVIEAEGGRVVKTIGDSILAKFDDPVSAIKAGAGMQRALARDREGREEIDQIRIRIGLHHGFGLVKDNDVFGDVVNAASRVENQAEADQVLITDALLEAATAAGFQYIKMVRAQLRGKDEPIDLYAVAWSESAAQQLIGEVQARYEREIKDWKKQQDDLEAEFDKARDQWRAERRALNGQIDELEQSVERARQESQRQLSEELQAELRFQVEELYRSREQLEEEFAFARQKFEAERNNLKAQIAAMQSTVVDAVERSNNPARSALAVREQVEARVAEAKEEWRLQWSAERMRLLAEIERLKKGAFPSLAGDKKEAARKAVLEKLGKLPAGSAGLSVKTASQWETEFQEAKIQWETDRERLNLKIKKLETELQQVLDSSRGAIYEELRSQYEARLAETNRERDRLEQDIQSVTAELAGERQRLGNRISALEEALPQAQEAARKQALAELQNEFDLKLEEANRLRSRIERHYRNASQDWEDERRRLKKEIAALGEQLKEAKEAIYKTQKTSGPKISSD